MLDTWMSMLGLIVGCTSDIVIVPLSKNRVRMSLRLLPTTNCSTVTPICDAT